MFVHRLKNMTHQELEEKIKQGAAAVNIQNKTRETAPQDQEADANTAAAKKKPMTARCNTQPQRSNNEEKRSNYNRNQNKPQNNAELTEVNQSDTVRGDERPGHRVLTDDVIGLCDCSNTSALEAAVRPKCDTNAEEPIVNEIVKDSVHPKSDMDAEKSAETENENDAVCLRRLKRQLSMKMRQTSKKILQLPKQQQ